MTGRPRPLVERAGGTTRWGITRWATPVAPCKGALALARKPGQGRPAAGRRAADDSFAWLAAGGREPHHRARVADVVSGAVFLDPPPRRAATGTRDQMKHGDQPARRFGRTAQDECPRACVPPTWPLHAPSASLGPSPAGSGACMGDRGRRGRRHARPSRGAGCRCV